MSTDTEPHSEPHSEPHIEPNVEIHTYTANYADADADAVTAAPPVVRGRPPRTAALLLSALLLGPVLGAGIGYAIQAGRPPTPLPPVQLTTLPQYPAGTLDPAAAAEAAPKPLAIDGDLRKLLLSKPADAQDWDDYGFATGDGWQSVGDAARSDSGSPEHFRAMLQSGLRRIAIVGWQKGNTKYLVRLIQYGPDSANGAISGVWRTDNQTPLSFANGMEGGYGAPSTPQQYAESTEQYYYGIAQARRGGVLMMVEVFSPAQVNADEVRDLAQRQWEQLA